MNYAPYSITAELSMPEAASYDMLGNTQLYMHTGTRRDRPVDRNQGEAKVGHLLLLDTRIQPGRQVVTKNDRMLRSQNKGKNRPTLAKTASWFMRSEWAEVQRRSRNRGEAVTSTCEEQDQ
jgi:hypothetical protein